MTLPLTNTASQKFSININEISYNMEVNWNTLYGFWTLDISSDTFTALGIKLVSGIDILGAFPDAPFTLLSNNIDDPIRFGLDKFLLEVTYV